MKNAEQANSALAEGIVSENLSKQAPGVSKITDSQQSGQFRLDGRMSWIILCTLTAAYALSYIDRQLLNLLVDPIKLSLQISDTQFSFIQGMAFVIAYLAAAPVFGRLVDVTVRRNILVFGVCSWSFFTAACGFVDSYIQLFAARIGVGFSEACILPVAMSMISDAFSREKTPRAMSVFFLGVQLGSGLSLLFGGLVIVFAAALAGAIPGLHQLEQWQAAFVVIGFPGMLFGALIFITMIEPPRGRGGTEAVSDEQKSLRAVMAWLVANRQFYGRIYPAVGIKAIITLGMPSWYPAYLMRAHDLPMAGTGLKLGIVSIVLAAIGITSGPVFSSWLSKRGHMDAPLRASALATIGMAAFAILIPFAPNAMAALIIAGGVYFFGAIPSGIAAAATQNASPNQMRGVISAIYTFSAMSIGYFLGPTIIALITDLVFGDPVMVGYSLQIVLTASALIAGFLLYTAMPHYRTLIRDGTLQTEKSAS